MTYGITTLEGAPASYVIVQKDNGKAICELFAIDYAKPIPALINTQKYRAVPILEHLHNLNRSIQETAQ